MKKLIIILALLLSFGMTASAQKTGYVDTEVILSEIPEYDQAQQQLERLREQYEVQLQNEVSGIEVLYNNYQSEKNRLTQEQRDQREREIILRERDVKEKQQEIFGQDGILAEKSRELIAPLRERVQAAINEVAKEQGFALVLDVAAIQGIVYRDNNLDLTPFVLAKMEINI